MNQVLERTGAQDIHALCERTVYFINPAAGSEAVSQLKALGEVYTSEHPGDTERKIREILQETPRTHLVVFGGDGTVHEAVNGIMAADCGETAVFSVIPAGTGNDFVRNFSEHRSLHEIDLVRCGDRYTANMVNIGFDCAAAERAASLKRYPLLGGSMAYVAGVVVTLLHKMGQNLKITAETADGPVTAEGEFLLCAAANGAYCGGGFKGAAAADLKDGFFDLMIVNKISRPKFLTLVSHYKTGSHVTQDARVHPKFQKILRYHRCTEAVIEGFDRLCLDGEIVRQSSVSLSIVPRAVRYLHLDPKRFWSGLSEK